MNKAEGQGKTLDAAIEDAIKKLNCSRDDVTIKVLKQGGLLSKYRVEAVRDILIDEQIAPDIEKKQIEVAEAIPIKEIKKQAENKKNQHLTSKQLVAQTKKTNDARENLVATSSPAALDVKAFLEGVAERSQATNAKVEVLEGATQFVAKLTGDNMATLIGGAGETLSAIQYVASVISGKNKQTNKRTYVDIGGYKEGKQARLHAMADKAREKVEATGESYSFRSMPSYERRIIHSYLQQFDNLKTYSRGDEPNRYLVVALKKD